MKLGMDQVDLAQVGPARSRATRERWRMNAPAWSAWAGFIETEITIPLPR